MPKNKKLLRMARAWASASPPVMLAIAGDSAAGKTTLAKGLVDALGADRVTCVSSDDYCRYDRRERKTLPFTELHPDCNYLQILELDLYRWATGQPVLKPVYDHDTGQLTRPELVKPTEFVIVEGLLPLHTRQAQACFDITVYLDPPEHIRRDRKVMRDTSKRGYTPEQVLAELDKREPESEAFIRPQRSAADIVVRFGPIEQRHDPPETPLSAELTLRPTIRHPDLTYVFRETDRRAMHLRLARDEVGRPVEQLHIHGYVPREESRLLEQVIWAELDTETELPSSLGQIGVYGTRSEPLAITQLLLLSHMLDAVR